jgi:hypothetical protein
MNDKEKEIIDRVANKIVETDLQGVAIFLLQTLRPLYFIGGELARFFLAPFLILLDEKGYEIIDTFEKRENIDVLTEKIEELTINKTEEKAKEESLPTKTSWSFREKISKFLK